MQFTFVFEPAAALALCNPPTLKESKIIQSPYWTKMVFSVPIRASIVSMMNC